MFTFSRLVAELGTMALSIHNICGSLCDIYYSFSQGLGKASLVQAGQALGSGRAGNLRQITTASRLAALWTSGGAMLLCGPILLPLVVSHAISLMQIVSPLCFPSKLTHIISVKRRLTFPIETSIAFL